MNQQHRTLVDVRSDKFQETEADIIIDLQQMADIASSFITSKLVTDIALEDLLELTPADTLTQVERERLEFGKPPEERDPALDKRREGHCTPAYEIRYRDAKFNILGITNHDTIGGWTNKLIATVRDYKAALQAEQDGDWMPVAFSIQRDSKTFGGTRPRVKGEDTQIGKFDEMLDVVQTKQVATLTKHPILWVCMAWVDVRQGDPVDQWYERTGKAKGVMEKYVAQRQLRFLSARLSQEREQAVALIREFYDVTEVTEAPGPEVYQEAARGPEWNMGMAYTLWQDGYTYAQIGALFPSLPWQTIKKLLLAHKKSLELSLVPDDEPEPPEAS